ncbi:hypothetical protein DNTS_003501 [Danionella cerebrum]|uniref:Uncharacterized protein n=1 Tax=Danionella cerebrum TaxID=2873325 RepID=A0A553MLG0_9TELE|nr:hypothetical protein DNTS_003501 [Danionella translucida]
MEGRSDGLAEDALMTRCERRMGSIRTLGCFFYSFEVCSEEELAPGRHFPEISRSRAPEEHTQGGNNSFGGGYLDFSLDLGLTVSSSAPLLFSFSQLSSTLAIVDSDSQSSRSEGQPQASLSDHFSSSSSLALQEVSGPGPLRRLEL